MRKAFDDAGFETVRVAMNFFDNVLLNSQKRAVAMRHARETCDARVPMRSV